MADLAEEKNSMTPVGIGEIEEWLVQAIAERLGWPEDSIERDQPFTSFGLDSVLTINLIGALEKYLGCSVPVTLVWEYPTIELLARYLAGAVSSSDQEKRSRS